MSHIEDNKEKKSKSSHTKHHHHHSHHHHHHNGSSSHHRKKEYDPSSEMERRRQNIIYDNVRKERIGQMVKRSIFVILAVSILLILIYFMISPNEGTRDLFNSDTSKEEINVLKNKIINYEYYIEELEERLSKYEKVESIVEKNE